MRPIAIRCAIAGEPRVGVNPIEAEARAIEEGIRARIQPDGSFRIRCVSGEHESGHRVTFRGIVKGDALLITFDCDCPSGRARPSDPVACLHGAIIGRRLQRMGWATWREGYWYATELARSQAQLVEPALVIHDAQGNCRSCGRFHYVKGTSDNPEPQPEQHDPACWVEYVKRREEARRWKERYEEEHGKPFDLWER